MATKTKSDEKKDDPCSKGYKQMGTKVGKKVPDCVPQVKIKSQRFKIVSPTRRLLEIFKQ